jgi:cell division protein ZipA
MSELRWILLVLGLLLIGGIYAWGVRSRRRSAAPQPERMTRVEPQRPAVAPLATRRIEPEFGLEDEVPEEAGPEEPDDSLDDTDRLPVLEIETEDDDDDEEEAAVRHEPAPRREPRIEPDAPAAPPAPAQGATASTAPARGEPTEVPAQKIFVVRVVAQPPAQFDGAALLESLRAERLEFGRYEIFHRLEASGRPVFSVASLREPGTFDPDAMSGTEFRGVALFAVLPGPMAGQRALEDMIVTARSLAARLGGVLQDEKGAALSLQRIGHLRDAVADFERARAQPPVR